MKYDFTIGAKLFGMFGIVEVDQSSKVNDTIKTLGFFRDFCNIERFSNFSSTQKAELKEGRPEKSFEADSLPAAYIFVIVLSVFACCIIQCFCMYMFLKHRQKLGFGNNKRDKDGESAVVAEDSNSSAVEGSAIGLEITP